MESKKTIGADPEVGVESGKELPGETREEFMRRRDLKDLPGYDVYEKESHFTPEWRCRRCDVVNPCAVSTCVQCGVRRPQRTHGDPEQLEEFGTKRKKAGWRE